MLARASAFAIEFAGGCAVAVRARGERRRGTWARSVPCADDLACAHLCVPLRSPGWIHGLCVYSGCIVDAVGGSMGALWGIHGQESGEEKRLILALWLAGKRRRLVLWTTGTKEKSTQKSAHRTTANSTSRTLRGRRGTRAPILTPLEAVESRAAVALCLCTSPCSLRVEPAVCGLAKLAGICGNS